MPPLTPEEIAERKGFIARWRERKDVREILDGPAGEGLSSADDCNPALRRGAT